MSFGGGFGGFGSGNNSSSGFGGFGANNNTNTTSSGFGSGGFGSNTNNTTNNSGGGLFGNTSSGFGGFGSNNSSSGFGANKPSGFGASNTSSGGGLFGNNANSNTTSNSGFGGGFGSNTNNTPAGGFGSSTNTSGGLFGSKPGGFGSGTTNAAGGGSGGMFGGGTTGSSGFGSSAANPTFGGNATNTGTGNTQFQPTNEKDGTNNVSYQTITFQQPYQNFSLEELRVVDYQQGRKFGNQNGQGGAFGASSGFGGFGSTANNNSGFGSNNNASSGAGGLFGGGTATSGFGANNTASSGFGGNQSSGGGLFGQNKPAGGGGLFGNTNATTSAQSGGGLFGTSGNTGGFGSNNNAGNTGGGLFGNAANQPKPAFGGFGGGNSTFGGGTTGGFGQQGQQSSTSAGGGLFGNTNNTSTSGGFGTAQQKPAFGGFGQTTNTPQNQPQGGGLFGGGGGFGNNQQQPQQKPGGLFGSSTNNTGGGLFGNTQNQTQNQGGGLFGNANNQQQNNAGGGLFGSKPAAGGLFGNSSSTTNTNTGGGLFGNANNQQQMGGGSSLFGPKPATGGGLFGNNNAASTNTGGGLFGNIGQNNAQPNQAAGASLFGNANQNQQQQPQTNSLFGGSQQNQNNQLASSMTTSLNSNPYGHEQLFANLATPSQSIGPLATPLSNSQRMKKSAVLPHYKVNPNASSRLITPQKRTQGYGFSYSTYGTPGSAISTGGSPAGGFGHSLIAGGSLGRSIGKSVSMSNLRYTQNAEDTILAPGAFSTNGNRYLNGGNSIKRLNVDRGLGHIRAPLFGSAEPAPKKRVSFGPSTSGDGAITNGSISNEIQSTPSNGALVRVDSDSPSTPTANTSKGKGNATNGVSNGTSSAPEMSQVNGNELAIVPEHDSPLSPATQQQRDNERAKLAQRDQLAGDYWSKPSIDELKKMPVDKLKSIKDFKVGRYGVGQIEFSCVDLSNTPIDKICGQIVILEHRNATVYGHAECPVPTPPQGKDMNVPSIITLENSFPRSQGGKLPVYEKQGSRYNKHIERLKRVPDTEFIDYDKKTGAWKFRVQHYTTYGLDDDDDEEEYPDSSIMDADPGTPTPMSRTPITHGSAQSRSSDDVFMPSPEESDPDDTFDFKNLKNRSLVPGGFDDDVVDDEPTDGPTGASESFLDERSVGSLAEMEQDDRSEISERSELGSAEDPFMAGGFPSAVRTTEHTVVSPTKDSVQPKSILKTSQHPFGQSNLGSAVKPIFRIEADWTEQLQRTASPKKDRQALRQSQAALLEEGGPPKPSSTTKTASNTTFQTGLDLMNSLFGSESGRKSARGKKQSKGIEWQYAKKPRLRNDLSDMDENDRQFHLSLKPNWGPASTFTRPSSGVAGQLAENVAVDSPNVFTSELRDVKITKLVTNSNLLPSSMEIQKAATRISVPSDGIPVATVTPGFRLDQFAQRIAPLGGQELEQNAWQLASILFDKLPADNDAGVSEDVRRKEMLCDFWANLVDEAARAHVHRASSTEEKALAFLSANNVADACSALIDGSDIRLATMIAQIGGDDAFRKEVEAQIESWREQNMLSEMTDPIRALYGLLAGHVAQCEGISNVGPEHKAPTFNISSQFELDWRRGFGLRLWYGILSDEPIESAVEMFAKDLESPKEVRPVPWFAEGDVATGWNDPTPEDREDLLWGLLKLYASGRNANVSATPASVLAPENTSGNPFDARLSFQFIHLLSGNGVIPRSKDGDETVAAADKLTYTYASALSSANPSHWLEAIRVLLHLSNPSARAHCIRELLNQHAADIDPDADTPPASAAPSIFARSTPPNPFPYLVHTLLIPRSWIYQSKALHARSISTDRAAEVRWLGEAGDWETAHAVLCSEVAPRAVLERDYDGLRELMGAFVEATENNETLIRGWNSGGGVYFDFVHLLDLEQSGKRFGVASPIAKRPGSSHENDGERSDVIQRLMDALVNMAPDMQRKGLQERAALWEMGRVVADAVQKSGAGEVSDKANTLRLPLTEDACLKHTRELGLGYYRAVLAGGR